MPAPKLIAVLGVTGAGKSTFINKAAGSSLGVGHGIDPCTQAIALADVMIDGTQVCLIDTPGFDDLERTDADILRLIAKWLAATYDEGTFLTGIILLQPITGNRAYGSEAGRTRLFRKICGEKAFDHVVIASTMWDDLKDKSQGENTVEERVNSGDFWANMVDNGAMVVNHQNNTTSARSIIRKLMNKKEVILQMQDELDKNNGRLQYTSAAQQLDSDLGRASAKEWERLNDVLQELRTARCDGVALQEELAQLKDKLKQLKQQRATIQTANHKGRKVALGVGGAGVGAGIATGALLLACVVM
ncbi:p-loop containing nucleoside triphosphate hydrolase protein [Venturia nashicola]|uniref:p-loop containing nucleoside triphosphate hydrolase protein n=1 Tax=Venturia nashicola TaxID=86259 RepID=A0A4Z1NMZ2_9PEZI|nr:p-loop containing nucleoside triphosphate hydrolase protein [Venturia nashicola]TLD20011.1 p-loop containing nucleoside triphosphate hydrolase protein [Venturia nashicola]